MTTARKSFIPTPRARTRCRVTVCRDCCCGTAKKHPDVDHDGQLATLAAGLGESGDLRVVECLGACEHSNLVVVQPSPAGRVAGGRAVWLGWVLDDTALGEITDWVAAGGPGVTKIPATLALHAFEPPKK